MTRPIPFGADLGAGTFRLWPDLPPDWVPEEIILCQYDLAISEQPPSIWPTMPTGCLVYDSGAWNPDDIDGFMRAATGGAPPGGVPRALDPSLACPTDTPWDPIIDGKRCWIVLSLNSEVNWQYPRRSPGITMKSDYVGNNRSVRYLAPDGETVILSDIPAMDGTLVAAFAVTARRAYERQRFNVHVELRGDDRFGPMSITFDPDVGNNGGSIP